jgi:hypothetical protein
MLFKTKLLLIAFIVAALAGCSGAPKKELTPLETLKAYGTAFKRKDLTAMKLLLSQETIKMHEQEARAQNVTLDDIVKRETLFSDSQTTANFRNQNIEDDKASIEVQDGGGIWNTVHFVKEEGSWRIDRKSTARLIQQEVQQQTNELDQLINQGRQ